MGATRICHDLLRDVSSICQGEGISSSWPSLLPADNLISPALPLATHADACAIVDDAPRRNLLNPSHRRPRKAASLISAMAWSRLMMMRQRRRTARRRDVMKDAAISWHDSTSNSLLDGRYSRDIALVDDVDARRWRQRLSWVRCMTWLNFSWRLRAIGASLMMTWDRPAARQAIR